MKDQWKCSIGLLREGFMYVCKENGHARNIKLLVAGILVAVSRDLQHRQAECVLCHKLS